MFRRTENGHDALGGSISIVPVMNLVLVLIPALLWGVVLVQVGVINVSSPPIEPGPPVPPDRVQSPDEPQPVNLTLMVTDEGFRIAARGGVLAPTAGAADQSSFAPTVPKKASGCRTDADGFEDCYDYEQLSRKLAEIKDLPQVTGESQIIIGAEPQVRYRVIIRAMDACRRDRHSRLLFPDVIISPGMA